MTYSIVARDPETGAIGVAVQTALPAVGLLCPWAAAGVGAVATQSLVRTSHGPSGLMLMRNGHTAAEALAGVLAADAGRERRQIGMIDANGVVDSFTGSGCIRFAGSHIGDHYAVQANMMAKDTVPDAMAAAFEGATGHLLTRMIAALQAAQAEGGDFRGQQSAALKIVSGELPKNTWEGVLYDIRVDDHATPVDELARIANRMLAWNTMRESYALADADDYDGALAKMAQSAEMDPEALQFRFSFALEMGISQGQLDLVADMLRETFQQDPMYIEYYRRLVEAGLIDNAEQQAKLEAIIAEIEG